MKDWKKLLLTILVFALLFGGCTYYNFGTFRSSNIAIYEKLLEEMDCLPELDELGDYESYDFRFYDAHQLIFYNMSYTLSVQYDEDTFAAEKAKLDETYVFQTEPVGDEFSGGLQEPEFELDGYQFRILSVTHYEMEHYPREFVFVGTSDDRQEIVYMYFYDPDLDVLRSFPEHFEKYCGWK